MRRMMADLEVDRKRNPSAFANDRWEDNDDNEVDDDGDGEDNDIIDRSELIFLNVVVYSLIFVR